MSSRSILYLVSWLATVSAGIAATLFSVYLPVIVADLLGSTAREDVARVGSWAGGAFLFGWAVGAVGFGALGDRIGRKRALALGVLTCSLGIIGTAFVQSLPMLVVLRVITGAGAGSILLLTAVMVSEAWATGDRARMVGILINAFPVGFILAGVIAANVQDFRTAYLIGGSTVVLAVVVAIAVPESAWWQRSGTLHAERHVQRERLWDAAYRRDLVVGLTLFGSMLVGLWALFVWGPTWVSSMSAPADAQRHRSVANIMLGVGSVIGGIISGPLSNALGRRRAAAVAYAGCFVVSALTFLTGMQPGTMLFGSMLLLSTFIGINQGVLSAYIPELFPTLVRAAATGVCFNAGRLITTVTVFFVGVLVMMLGGYHHAMFAFSFAYLIGLVALSMARETRGIMLPE